MREELATRNGLRGRFSATFARFGKKTAYKGPLIVTALMRDVRDEAGKIVTDHLWFVVGKGEFDEYDDRPAPSVDYRLERPTKVRKIGSAKPDVSLPLFEVSQ